MRLMSESKMEKKKITMLLMMMIMMMMMMMMMILAVAGGAVDAKGVAARNNMSCILVFGDSSVDPGNNNYIHTTVRANFRPYGTNFYGGRPTGRFTDGRLTTDFIADILGFNKVMPGFLQRNLTKSDLLHGVSFASASSGYDDLTSNLSKVIALPQQEIYLVKYINKLKRLVGVKEAEGIIQNALFLTSMGTNDFLLNYFAEPIRPKQFSLDEYQNFLVSRMTRHVKVLHNLGASRVIVVGVPPLGCMPIVKTLNDVETSCVDTMNKLALSFNSKLQKNLAILEDTLMIKTGFVDVYGIIKKAVDNPKLFGISETSKGCCGSGTIEYGDTCKGLSTCKDPSKYVFWDAVHPTQKIYKIIAENALETIFIRLFQ